MKDPKDMTLKELAELQKKHKAELKEAREKTIEYEASRRARTHRLIVTGAFVEQALKLLGIVPETLTEEELKAIINIAFYVYKKSPEARNDITASGVML